MPWPLFGRRHADVANESGLAAREFKAPQTLPLSPGRANPAHGLPEHVHVAGDEKRGCKNPAHGQPGHVHVKGDVKTLSAPLSPSGGNSVGKPTSPNSALQKPKSFKNAAGAICRCVPGE
ncbi:hypothetical protein MCOR17_011695, partial [Pyricularia oryzae]